MPKVPSADAAPVPFSIAVLSEFFAYLDGKGCSPNTIRAYAFDLRHFEGLMNKDSLEMTAEDRALILGMVRAILKERSRCDDARHGHHD